MFLKFFGGKLFMGSYNDIPKDADIIVIGGGMSGCATAYFLAKEGLNILLVEQESIASGATGSTGSCLMQMDGRAFTIDRVKRRLPFVREDVRLLKELDKEFNGAFDLQTFGSADLSNCDEETEDLINVTNIQKAAGDIEVEFLYSDALRELFPGIGKNIKGGKYTKNDGTINPISFAWTLAMSAVNNYKAKILLHTKVNEIIFKGNKAVGIKTSKGDYRANCWIINCTNAWSINIEKDIPIFPVRGVTSITEEVPLNNIISWESTYKGNYGYGTQQKKGNLVIGSIPSWIPETIEGHFDRSVPYEDIGIHSSILKNQFPFMKEVSLLRIFAGVMAMTPDRMPYIGPMPGYENYFINTGYSNGMAYCPIGAKLSSEYILNNRHTSLNMDLLKPERFFGEKFDTPKKYNYAILESVVDAWDL
jgi:sarcosine oxidase, subunit beta